MASILEPDKRTVSELTYDQHERIMSLRADVDRLRTERDEAIRERDAARELLTKARAVLDLEQSMRAVDSFDYIHETHRLHTMKAELRAALGKAHHTEA